MRTALRYPSPIAFYANVAKDSLGVLRKRNFKVNLANFAISALVIISMLLAPFTPGGAFASPTAPGRGITGASGTSTIDQAAGTASGLAPQVNQPGVERSAIPLYFEPNIGQSDPEARFLVHATGSLIFFTPSQVVLALKEPSSGSTTGPSNPRAGQPPQNPITQTVTPQAPVPAPVPASEPGPRLLRMSFLGADPVAQITAGEMSPGKVNYFLGDDPSRWHSNVPTYASIQYTGLYQGIDLKYESRGSQLKSTYLVAAGADPTNILWHYEGVDQISIDPDGNLQARLSPPKGRAGDGDAANTGNGGNSNGNGSSSQPITVTEQAPVAWQEDGGQKAPVTVSYVVASDGYVGFSLGTYDRTRPLVIDPYLTYSTYLGGNGADDANGLAIDSSGNAYITGSTTSTDFPISGAYQPANAGGNDAFVTKLNATGTALIYSTYLVHNHER